MNASVPSVKRLLSSKDQSITPNQIKSHTSEASVGLRIISANVNGLRGKMNEILLRSNSYHPNIFACQETKIDRKTDSSSLTINGFKLFRRDRSENGGGVALYISEFLNPNQLMLRANDDVEIVAVKCKLAQPLVIASIYRPPRQPILSFLESLSELIASMGDKNMNLILAGDLNICALLTEFKPIQDFCDLFDLKQIISSVTHIVNSVMVAVKVRRYTG
jgi:exonuclease III